MHIEIFKPYCCQKNTSDYNLCTSYAPVEKSHLKILDKIQLKEFRMITRSLRTSPLEVILMKLLIKTDKTVN